MAKIIHNPIDKLFKQGMADLRVAHELFEEHLPDEIKSIIDLRKIKCSKNSFIDPDFKATEADVLYQVQLKEHKGSAYLYLLCECQSTVAKNMPFRLLVYMTRILEMHMKQHPKDDLPIIFPVVIYSGQKKWHAPTEIFPLFGELEELARKTFLAPFKLIDLHRLDDDQIRQKQWSGLLEFALKHKHIQDFEKFLDTILPWLVHIEKQQGLNFASNVLRYLLDGIDNSNEQLFIEKAEYYLSDNLRGEAMTLAQRFKEIGIQEGMQAGMQAGIQKGIEEGMQAGILEGVEKEKEEMAIKLIRKGQSIEFISDLTGFSAQKISELKKTIS